MTSDLACAYRAHHGNSRRFDVVRNGSKIRKIGLKADCIVLHDVKDMLAAGSSLKTFAELAKLEIKKLAFPFNRFNGREFLEEKTLPKEAADWFDTLSQSTPSQETVDEVLAEFQAGGFNSVGEYLSHYLKIDVRLLGQATVKFFAALEETILSHPIDVGKLTMPSFASNAVQMYLYTHKRQGNTCPDYKPLYHAVRGSCLGGLCMVGRHDCTEGSPPINSHMVDPEKWSSGKTVVYLDETSLYGSAVSRMYFRNKTETTPGR